jgi:hypothetical protein
MLLDSKRIVMIKMNDENRLIIKQLNKFGRIPETSELLKMIEDLEKERTMYKTSFEVMSKNYFELQNNWNELKKCIEQWIDYHSVCEEDYKELNVLEDVESKMQELEGNND